MCIVFHFIYIHIHIFNYLYIYIQSELASQHVCNAYVHQPYSLGGLNLQIFAITARDQLGILTSNLNVVGVHAYHTNYITCTMRMSS